MSSEESASCSLRGLLAPIIFGGLVAGFLDGSDAVIFYGITRGVTFQRLFQFIASGLLGPRSFQGGWATVGLGVILHFTVATGAAAVYNLAALKIAVMVRRPWLCGPAFGLMVYAFMYRVVMPLSALPRRPSTIWWPGVMDEVFSHTLFVGLSIALIATRFARRRLRTGQATPG